MPTSLLVAAAVLIDADNRLLVARRPSHKHQGGKWEFPGGKIEQGETPEDCLVRELHEELGIEVKQACLAPYTFASHHYPELHLILLVYLCRRWKNEPSPQEGQEMQWVTVRELLSLEMPEADIQVIAMLRDLLL